AGGSGVAWRVECEEAVHFSNTCQRRFGSLHKETTESAVELCFKSVVEDGKVDNRLPGLAPFLHSMTLRSVSGRAIVLDLHIALAILVIGGLRILVARLSEVVRIEVEQPRFPIDRVLTHARNAIVTGPPHLNSSMGKSDMVPVPPQTQHRQTMKPEFFGVGERVDEEE
ncbi:hypothetical protein PFISCL1PPCAC_8678, partial [Pristionchus fissidentatus]